MNVSLLITEYLYFIFRKENEITDKELEKLEKKAEEIQKDNAVKIERWNRLLRLCILGLIKKPYMFSDYSPRKCPTCRKLLNIEKVSTTNYDFYGHCDYRHYSCSKCDYEFVKCGHSIGFSQFK